MKFDILGKIAGGGRKLQALIAILVALLLVDGAIVFYDLRQASIGTLYIATVGKLRMLSQRLAKAAQQASQGNPDAFKQLRESRDEFAAHLLMNGGQVGGVTLPASSEQDAPALEILETRWKKNERKATLVLAEQSNLLNLSRAVRAINVSNPALQELADEIAALSVQSGGGAANAYAAQLMMLAQRMAKNANAMLAEAVIDPRFPSFSARTRTASATSCRACCRGARRCASSACRIRSCAASSSRWRPRSRNISARSRAFSATSRAW